jgi:hypothetical protein
MEPIVLHLPASLKPLADLLDLAITFTQHAIDHARTDQPFDYIVFEQAVASLAMNFQQVLHQPVLAACDRDVRHVEINGLLHRRVGRYDATYYTLGGAVVVERTLYRAATEPRAKSVDPVSLRVGTVGAGWLPHTATAMAFMVHMDPSREVATHRVGTGQFRVEAPI